MLSINDPIVKWLGEWSAQLSFGAVCLRLGLAVLFSAVIGWERASKRHSAGLRTFILVAFASSIAMLLDLFLLQSTTMKFPVLSAASVLGIAMLSGNSVLYSSRNQIKGLTTSAGLWTCGIIGLTAGAGFYSVTIITSFLLLGILYYLPILEIYLKNRSNHFEIHLELTSKEHLQDFVSTVRRLGIVIEDVETNSAYVGSGLSVYSVTVTVTSEELKKYKTHSEIIEALKTLPYIYHIEEMR
ncbi:MAG: MgtC/SapB family protein [Clostridia bacterium]|nr:MgtC/SapB family protein [Clostridia bacterium]